MLQPLFVGLGIKHKAVNARTLIYHKGRRFMAFESHGAAAIGEIFIPGNIVMPASETIYHLT